jgi:hypothetical protein
MVSTSFLFNPTIREDLPMPTTIRYADILNYLTAIANKANNPIGDAPHGDWWSNLSYSEFLTAQVMGGVNVMDTDNPLQSAFYVILTNPNGAQNFPQMPAAGTNPAGPFITDAGYTATLPDNTTISGQQIQANIQSWLSNGYPE